MHRLWLIDRLNSSIEREVCYVAGPQREKSAVSDAYMVAHTTSAHRTWHRRGVVVVSDGKTSRCLPLSGTVAGSAALHSPPHIPHTNKVVTRITRGLISGRLHQYSSFQPHYGYTPIALLRINRVYNFAPLIIPALF